MTRVFVDEPCERGSLVSLHPADERHLTTVLRMQPGDELIVVSHGKPWRAKIEAAQTKRLAARILEPSPRIGELPVPITILQAIPKGNKMDDVIEKVTELGALRIVPVHTERSYGADSERKIDRWRRIARAAAAQAQRSFVPTVDAANDLHSVLEDFSMYGALLVASETAQAGSLALALNAIDPAKHLAILVGPEGSFSAEEIHAAKQRGAFLVSLGPTTLRTETAAAATIAAIASLRGWW